MKKNGKSNFYELLNDESIVSKSVKAVMMKNLKNDEKTGGFKVEEIIKLTSFKSFDFTISLSVIRNVLYKLDDDKYDKAKYEYCKQLKNIRNEKYAHLVAFDVDDIDFSVAIVTIEEVIRQLCDSNLSQDYLNEVEVELNKDNNEINSLKSDVVKFLAEQKEEIQTFIDSKTSRIELNISEIIEIIKKPGIELASHLPPCPPASKLYNRENESEIFLELAKHKLSCIAGMAGVGKSTLAITYGHHRKEERNAKVFIFFKFFLLIPS